MGGRPSRYHGVVEICDLIYKDFLIVEYFVECEVWGMGMGYDIDKLQLIEVY